MQQDVSRCLACPTSTGWEPKTRHALPLTGEDWVGTRPACVLQFGGETDMPYNGLHGMPPSLLKQEVRRERSQSRFYAFQSVMDFTAELQNHFVRLSGTQRSFLVNQTGHTLPAWICSGSSGGAGGLSVVSCLTQKGRRGVENPSV